MSDDFDDLSDVSFTSARVRRDDEAAEKEKCHHHRRHPMCCAEDLMDKLKGVDKDLKKSCFREVMSKEIYERPDPFSCENMEKRKKQITVSWKML